MRQNADQFDGNRGTAAMLLAEASATAPEIAEASIAARIKQMMADGTGPSAIAKAIKIGRASVYRVLAD